ncbi:4-hydroxy-tetrahydrodipicolinate synthase [Desulfovibrio sp. OttesenSCG-928-M14]|nr:4-hydroxy-tetrahydrodipicolinate synthase [Desulfovibrio sp. OttesenSCG-928-M14]
MQLKGAFTALVTPFKNGQVDEEGYRKLIESQIAAGIDGLVPCGTTGESATLSHDEHEAVIRICIEQTKGRVPVIAGAGSNNTSEAVSLARSAKKAGADAILLITPYYNKPTQEGLYAHFKAINDAVAIPAVVYNVPGRTSVSVAPATMARMYKDLSHVIGVKEATANLTHISEILEQCDDDFVLLSGDDFTVLPTLSIGGKGVISVVSNIVPADMAGLCAAYFAGDMVKAKALHYKLAPLSRACFLETNPVPVKTAMALVGQIGDATPRLPLVPLMPANLDKLKAAVKDYGLL